MKALQLHRNGDTTAAFAERLGKPTRTTKGVVRTLEKLGYIRRQRILSSGRWTYSLIRAKPKAVDPPLPQIRPQVLQALDKDGFVAADDLTSRERLMIVDPLFMEEPVVEVSLHGGAGYGKGSVKYSVVDFFGGRMSEIYYVSDLGKYRSHMGKRLELLFLRKNPTPESKLRAAFTRYLHDYSMHSSFCGHLL